MEQSPPTPNPSPASSPKRRARINPDPAAHAEWPLKHVAQGVEILTALDRHGFLTNGQIAELLYVDEPNSFGESRSARAAQEAANRALRLLWKGEYLVRQRVVLTSRQGHPYLHFVNVLSARGIAAVADYYRETESKQTVRSLEAPQLRQQQLEHAIALNDIYVLIARATRRQNITFALWRDDRQLTAMNREQRTGFLSIPDAMFGLQRPGGGHTLYFLELDLATESVFGVVPGRNTWRAKIERHEQYFKKQYGNEALFAGLPAPTVLCITDGARRLANLIAATEEAGAAPGRYWFATRDELANFWGAIWSGTNGQSGRSLLAQLG